MAVRCKAHHMNMHPAAFLTTKHGHEPENPTLSVMWRSSQHQQHTCTTQAVTTLSNAPTQQATHTPTRHEVTQPTATTVAETHWRFCCQHILNSIAGAAVCLPSVCYTYSTAERVHLSASTCKKAQLRWQQHQWTTNSFTILLDLLCAGAWRGSSTQLLLSEPQPFPSLRLQHTRHQVRPDMTCCSPAADT